MADNITSFSQTLKKRGGGQNKQKKKRMDGAKFQGV